MAKIHRLLSVEGKAQDLMERSISRLLGESTLPRDIARKLVKTADLSQHLGQVCDRYWVYLSPAEMAELSGISVQLEDDLSRFLSNYIEDVELAPLSPIKVVLVSNDDDGSRTPSVVPSCALNQVENTKAMPVVSHGSMFEELNSLDAFLIDGARHIPLDRPTSTLGRHLENDIVVESNRASRRHAQIRWRHGRFVIHDLGSKIGTLINGLPVRESVLSPGDVIKIGEYSYVYGEGLTPVESGRRRERDDMGITQALDTDNT
jgi:hypothetical protein